MVNDLFRELVGVIRNYSDPIFAQVIIKKNCETCGASPDTVDLTHLPNIMLQLSTDSQLLAKLKSHEFSSMMKKFMSISNRSNETVDSRSIRKIVKEYRSQDMDDD